MSDENNSDKDSGQPQGSENKPSPSEDDKASKIVAKKAQPLIFQNEKVLAASKEPSEIKRRTLPNTKKGD